MSEAPKTPNTQPPQGPQVEAQPAQGLEQQAQIDQSQNWRDAVTNRIAGLGESIGRTQRSVRDSVGELSFDRARQTAKRVGERIMSASPTDLLSSVWEGAKDFSSNPRDYIRQTAIAAGGRVAARSANNPASLQLKRKYMTPAQRADKAWGKREAKKEARYRLKQAREAEDAELVNLLFDRYLKFKDINDARNAKSRERRQDFYDGAKFLGKTILSGSRIVVADGARKLKQTASDTIWRVRLNHELNRIQMNQQIASDDEKEKDKVGV